MNDDIVIRIPYRVLRELIDTHDAANDNAEPIGDKHTNERPWSDRQRRFIYRLLLRLGHEGDAAKSYIKTALHLNGAPPTSRQASQLIDKLQIELGEGNHDAA